MASDLDGRYSAILDDRGPPPEVSSLQSGGRWKWARGLRLPGLPIRSTWWGGGFRGDVVSVVSCQGVESVEGGAHIWWA
nr:hypothetical protein JVH1_6676 [Rhodococcus sp. JVH1]